MDSKISIGNNVFEHENYKVTSFSSHGFCAVSPWGEGKCRETSVLCRAYYVDKTHILIVYIHTLWNRRTFVEKKNDEFRSNITGTNIIERIRIASKRHYIAQRWSGGFGSSCKNLESRLAPTNFELNCNLNFCILTHYRRRAAYIAVINYSSVWTFWWLLCIVDSLLQNIHCFDCHFILRFLFNFHDFVSTEDKISFVFTNFNQLSKYFYPIILCKKETHVGDSIFKLQKTTNFVLQIEMST